MGTTFRGLWVITIQAYCHMANQNVSRRHSTSMQFKFKYYTSLFWLIFTLLFLSFVSEIVDWLLLLDLYQQITYIVLYVICSHTVPKSDNGMSRTWLQWVYLLSWCWQLCICCSSCHHATCMHAQGPVVAPALRKCTVPSATSPLPHETYQRTQRDST